MPLSEEQLWQVMKAAALLDPNVRGNLQRAADSQVIGARQCRLVLL
jgi:hypothetical protein